MPLKEVLRLMPAPASPCETGGPQRWREVQAELRTGLPTDYCQFIERYGTGCVDEYLWVLSPFTEREPLHLVKEGARLLKGMRYLRTECGDEQVPYPVFPEPGGVLPWGVTDNGDMLFWVTKGEPGEWFVAVNEGRGPMWEECHCSMVDFLVRVLSKEFRSEIMAVEFPSDSPEFRVVAPTSAETG